MHISLNSPLKFPVVHTTSIHQVFPEPWSPLVFKSKIGQGQNDGASSGGTSSSEGTCACGQFH